MSSQQCPVCSSANQRGSTAHAGDTPVHRIFFTPLRCRDCRVRYWVYSPTKILLFTIFISVLVLGVILQQLAISSRDEQQATLEDDPFTRLTALAKRGDVNAELRLGKLYANGEGVLVNRTEAVKWFEKAARHGNSEAQFLYALALLEGHGVVQDYQAALNWIVKPANDGNPEAQYRLGQMYHFGIGTPVNKAMAYMWFNLAAAQGVDAAIRARESVVGQLKPEQIALAQADARRISEKMGRSPGQRTAATSPPPALP